MVGVYDSVNFADARAFFNIRPKCHGKNTDGPGSRLKVHKSISYIAVLVV